MPSTQDRKYRIRPLPATQLQKFPCRTLASNPEPDACRNEGIDNMIQEPLHLSTPLLSFKHFVPYFGTTLLTLALLLPPAALPAALPSSACLSKNPVHSSAKLSLGVPCRSGKNSALRLGVLGVRWKGLCGRRSEEPAVPGRARPACSFCSSVQERREAMTWRIWNFLGSERSRARKRRK